MLHRTRSRTDQSDVGGRARCRRLRLAGEARPADHRLQHAVQRHHRGRLRQSPVQELGARATRPVPVHPAGHDTRRSRAGLRPACSPHAPLQGSRHVRAVPASARRAVQDVAQVARGQAAQARDPTRVRPRQHGRRQGRHGLGSVQAAP